MAYIANQANLDSMVVIGDGGITEGMRASGYVATICALASGSMSPDVLQSRIALVLKRIDRESAGATK